MHELAISLKNVSKQFGKKTAVANLTLEVPRGEILTILGPNGAGKSTTIALMLGMLKSTSGKVLLDGCDPRIVRNRRCYGAMLQHIGLPDTMTPRELIALWRTYYPHPLPFDSIVAIAGISEVLNEKFGRLSGGQKRRVAFALAVCGNPSILFLDEPSAGLDITSRKLLWEEINRFAKMNKTVVLCTHYLEEADALSDRIVLINRGSIIADGSPENIKATIGTKTIRFRSEVAPNILRSLPTVERVAIQAGFAVIESAMPELVLQHLFAKGIACTDLEVTNISLEAAFHRLTQQN